MIKKILVLVLASLASLCVAVAQKPTDSGIITEKPEVLKYSAYFNWSAIWVRGGEAVFTAVRKGDYYHYKVEAYTLPKWRWIYDMSTKIEAYMHVGSMNPVSYNSLTSENKHVHNERISYYGNRLKYSSWSGSQSNADSQDVLRVDNSYDLLNMVYYARNLDLKTIKVGEPLEFNVYFTSAVTKIGGSIVGKETTKLKSGKEYKCIKCKANSISGTIFDASEPVFVWVTDDDAHKPVRVRAKIKVGYIDVELEE